MTTQLNQLTELTTTSDDDLILIREDSTGIDKKMKAQNIRAKATTKADVGLSNVDNVSAADLRDRSTHTGTQTLATISDAGTAAAANVTTTDTDTTAGRLLKVGDYGAGAAAGTLLFGTGNLPSSNQTITGNWTFNNRLNAPELSAIISSTGGSTGEVSTNHDRLVIASDNSTASGGNSAVIASQDCISSERRSVVIGCNGCEADGLRAVVVGGDQNKALGNISGIYSSNVSETTGVLCAVIGAGRVKNQTDFSIALGRDPNNAGDASTANRNIHLFGSSGNVSISGSLSQGASFSDFAEMMPNGTGEEIPVGTLLTMKDDKVYPADDGDEIVGVVSKTAAVVAGDSPFCWSKRYMTGEFGERLYEEKMVDGKIDKALKQNPDWNPDLPQVSRLDRPDEWTVVGMLGQVYIRTGEQVKAGDRITAKGGKGYATTERTGLKVMQVTKDFDGDYGIARCLINVMV